MSKKNKKYELGGRIIKALKGARDLKRKAVNGIDGLDPRFFGTNTEGPTYPTPDGKPPSSAMSPVQPIPSLEMLKEVKSIAPKANEFDVNKLADSASGALNSVIPGSGLALQMAMMGINHAQNLRAEYKQENRLNLTEDTNPYAEYGTKLGNKDFQSYEGAKHAQGGIDISSDGSLGGDAVEVEGGESRYKDYVYSDALPNIMDLDKTYAETTKALIKKYKNSDFDLTQKAALDIEMKRLAELNTLHRKSMEAADTGGKPKAVYGTDMDTDPTKPLPVIGPLAPSMNSFGVHSKTATVNPMGSPSTSMNSSMYKMGMKPQTNYSFNGIEGVLDEDEIKAGAVPEVTTTSTGTTRKDKIKSFFKVLNRDLGEVGSEINNKADSIAKTAPDYIQSINNALQAMEKPMTESPIMPNYSRARDYMDRGSIDFSEGENTISRMSNAARQSIRNSVRSTPISQALQANTDANAMAQMSQLKQQEEVARAQQAGGYAQMEGNMANAEAQALYQNRVDNLGNRAASRNMRNAAVAAFMQDRNTVMQRENERELNIFNNKQVAEIFKAVAPDMKNELIARVDKASKAKTKVERDAAYEGLDNDTIKLVDEALEALKNKVKKK
jgi:hypothetical protein